MGFYNNFNQEDLADLLEAYDHYIAEAAAVRAFETGWTPVCVEEFYEHEYRSIWKSQRDFSDYFFQASEMSAAEITPHALALAIDEFYYQFDTYNYKDEIDDRAEAVASLEADILEGKIDELKEYLKNEMLSYGETDSISMAAKLIISQMERYQKQEKASQPTFGEGSNEHLDVIEISCYADQVLPRTDRSELLDTYQSAQFTVPGSWAEEQAKEMGFKDLNDFLDNYTWDHVDGWYAKAFHDGVLLGVGLGQTSGREARKVSLAANADLSFDEKLFNAKETAQNKQSPQVSVIGSKSI